MFHTTDLGFFNGQNHGRIYIISDRLTDGLSKNGHHFPKMIITGGTWGWVKTYYHIGGINIH